MSTGLDWTDWLIRRPLCRMPFYVVHKAGVGERCPARCFYLDRSVSHQLIKFWARLISLVQTNRFNFLPHLRPSVRVTPFCRTLEAQDFEHGSHHRHHIILTGFWARGRMAGSFTQIHGAYLDNSIFVSSCDAHIICWFCTPNLSPVHTMKVSRFI
jgi:hypothetical protein